VVSRTNHIDGDVLGRWKLVAYINTGGNGDVWRAEANSETVALKILHRTDPAGYERFRREVAICEALRRIAAHGLYDDKYFFCNVPVPCDHTFTMLVRAIGLGIRSFDRSGEPFRIWHGELPDTPANLLAAGHAIIHSLKSYPGRNEEALRAYFRAHRHRVSQRLPALQRQLQRG